MREQFDKKLRERLRKYAEEPAKDFWKQIAPHINTVNPQSKGWARHLSVVVIGIVSIFVVSVDRFRPRDTELSFAAFQASADDTEVPFDQSAPVDIICAGKVVTVEGNSQEKDKLNSENDWFINDDELNSFLPVVSIVSLSANKSVEDHTRSSFDSLPIQTRQPITIRVSEDKALIKRKEKDIFRRGDRLPLYFTVMPTFGYQRIESNDNDNVLIQSVKRVPTFSIERLGVRVELGMQGYLSSRWRAFGGILYYQREQTIDFVEKYMDTLLLGSAPGGNLTLEPKFNYRARTLEHKLRNLGLHFGLSYLLSTDENRPPRYGKTFSFDKMPERRRMKFAHQVGAGIELHKSLNDAIELSGADGFTSPPLYAFLNVYYRLQYPDKGRLRAILQPTLNYSFYMHKDINSPFYVKPYGFGLNFGCMYQL